MKTLSFPLLSALLLTCAVMTATAQRTGTPDVPRTISYQGLLSSSNGTPLPDGTYDITVSLFLDEAGAQPLWHATYNTAVRNGVFNLYLGSGNAPLPSPIQMNRPLWVGTSVNGSPTMLPLTPLASSPYALNLPDQTVTTAKLADGAVTADKMGTPYIAGIALNGKTITADGTVLNIEVGNGIALTYDEETRTLKLSKAAPAVQGDGEKGAEVQDVTYTTSGNWIGRDPASGGGNYPFYDVPNAVTSIYNTLGAGYLNVIRASVNYSTIPGGYQNLIDTASDYSFIGGGETNIIKYGTDNSTIVGGDNNTIERETYSSAIVGGAFNTIETNTSYDFIGGGQQNRIENYSDHSAVIGGQSNLIEVNSDRSVIGGGYNNIIDTLSPHSVIGGGESNFISDTTEWVTIAGGHNNTIHSHHSFIGGGHHDTILGIASTIGGGWINTINGDFNFVGGGRYNTAEGDFATVAGGRHVRAQGTGSFVGGGGTFEDLPPIIPHVRRYSSVASGIFSVVTGGFYDTASGDYAFSGGGSRNHAAGDWSTIVGGDTNHILLNADYSFIGGGRLNDIHNSSSVIGGGDTNTIMSAYSAIVGGDSNLIAIGDYSFIGAGDRNKIRSESGVIGGGRLNVLGTTSGASNYSMVGAGDSNTIDGANAFIGGGRKNRISAFNGVIGGGRWNVIEAGGSVIGGGFGDTIMSDAYESFMGGGADNRIRDGAYLSVINGGNANIIDVDASFSTIGGGSGHLITSPAGATETATLATIPGGDNLIAQSWAQTVIGGWNLAKGSVPFRYQGTHDKNDPIFIIGNGFSDQNRSNAFEVSYNGHSIVYHRNNTGTTNAAIRGGTYTDNVVYAWAYATPQAAPPRVTVQCDFGVANIAYLGLGHYRVTMNLVNPDGTPMTINCGSVTATTVSQGRECLFINTTPINSNAFDIYISEPDCDPADNPFTFKVTGVPSSN